jgi:putative ATP-binding cassette transporter
MKRNNKLVIVITHDDRYFDCADRVIFMEDGKMIGVQEADPHSAPRTGSHSFLPDSVMAGAATGQ